MFNLYAFNKMSFSKTSACNETIFFFTNFMYTMKSM